MTELLAGTSGYAYKPWKGPFYPADLPDSEMLSYYASRLPAVEINNTFYRMPKEGVLATWSDSTPGGFRFILKASRKITHFQRLKDCAEPLDYLVTTAGTLGDRLGGLLFQLPPNMRADLGRLEAFLDLLPTKLRCAFEFRHASWFEDPVFDALRARGAALCISDFDDADKTTPRVKTADWGYLRLRRSRYGDPELLAWRDYALGQDWRVAYMFFKHEDEGAAAKMALRLMTGSGER